MIARRGLNIVELDHQASAANQPIGIITADCSSPREIDDGVFVEALPSAQEAYRVGVCVADTSGLYGDREIVKGVLRKTAARYWTKADGTRGYDPMIDPEAIRELEFKRGKVRDALIVSFVVGAGLPPCDVDISFGKVEIRRNLNYKDFGSKCRYSDEMRRFGRASAFIIDGLGLNLGGDDDFRHVERDPDALHRRLIHVPSQKAWQRGSRLNEPFMAAACSLVGKTLAAEGRTAIYRVHDPDDSTFAEFIPPSVARFSLTPGPHVGLGLKDPYSRVTSPLRRAEDFMMSHQLQQRHLGRAATQRDTLDLAAAVQRLNQEIVGEISRGPLRLGRQDVLGNEQGSCRRATRGAQIIQLHPDMSEAATA